MSTQLVIVHKPMFKAKPYRVEKHYFDDSGYCFREDKMTWLEFATKKQAETALKELESNQA
jgi:hypothetical protein